MTDNLYKKPCPLAMTVEPRTDKIIKHFLNFLDREENS